MIRSPRIDSDFFRLRNPPPPVAPQNVEWCCIWDSVQSVEQPWVQEAVRQWGLPNGYILGQEASAAFVGGLRYGEGQMYTRNAGDQKIFWQGPSVGFDAGADGDRTMMLVYNLPAVNAIFHRFGGIDGSAYFVGGFGFTALSASGVVVVPIRSGIGARLGINISYLKFTPRATWNPF